MATLLSIVAGCGGPSAVVAPANDKASNVIPPAGVDTSVAIIADSLARSSFVSFDEQEHAEALMDEARALVRRSDTLWKFLQMPDDETTVNAADSIRALNASMAAGKSLIALDALLQDVNADSAAVTLQVGELLDRAEAGLEESVKLNPFDDRSRLWLARVYEFQAQRTRREGRYEKAIEAVEKLVALRPDEHSLYAMLANNYYRTGQWRRALGNYERAESIYLETRELDNELAGTQADDTLVHYQYVRAQGDVLVRLRNAAGASTKFRQAALLAPNSDELDYVESELEWINWDGGNIDASFARDSLIALLQTGAVEDAARGFRELLGSLQTSSARDEAEWRLAVAEFNLGAGQAAAGRLQHLVSRLKLDESAGSKDSLQSRYIEDYGVVCFNLGHEYLQRHRDNRTALMYFEQSSRVDWSGRPRAHLEVASLLQSNLDASLTSAEKALAEEQRLLVDDRKVLYQLLMTLYRRKADFEKARTYRDKYRAL